MSKANPLAGLIGNYGDSDDESEDGMHGATKGFDPSVGRVPSSVMPTVAAMTGTSGTIHPAPIPHCPWSACYDESSGFTYYWNQQTNAVTWEAPPEYLLALKLAQQQLHSAGSTEVSAEEWQLYQQALAEKQNSQNKVIAKTAIQKPVKKNEKPLIENKDKKVIKSKKRPSSDDEEEKIELITSYYNSDSDSNDETDTPVKPKPATPPVPVKQLPKNPAKKQKIKPPAVGPVLEYGPSLPPSQNYSMAIGPELPSTPIVESNVKKSPEIKVEKPIVKEEDKEAPKENETEDDESSLLTKLKDKAKLLEKLGGEIPMDLQMIIQDEPKSQSSPARTEEISKDKDSTVTDSNIDDLLQEIENKELPKIKSKGKIDMFGEENYKSKESSARNSPKSIGDKTPPLEEFKPLFPSSNTVVEESELDKPVSLFPSSITTVKETEIEVKPKSETPPLVEKKGTNMYLMDANEVIENTNRKKLRISNSVLPERKKSELPSYTTKYSQFIEGFSSERTGLGFSKEEDETESPRNTISYGNGLTFTKGEILNEDKKDEDLDDLTDLVEAKLKYLNQLQPSIITPVQEMLIQMQTLASAFRAGALSVSYWRRWAEAGAASLAQHEASAAPPGWTCSFQRSEGRYRYRRIADGLTQWEYPASQQMDMDICTTPPHIPSDGKDEYTNPPLPPSPPPPPPAPAPPLPESTTPPPPGSVGVTPRPSRSMGVTPPPPPSRPRVATPPPPMWHDPPPPGCDDVPPPPPPEPPKVEIGDELLSFYNDIAELEKVTSGPHTAQNSPEPIPPPVELKEREWERERGRSKEKEGKEVKTSKKKTKVKISSSIGMKHKSVSNLVAKWQQVAEEINSD